jgi:chromate reductase, NAD(P)H dehydrogenase (quinone)
VAGKILAFAGSARQGSLTKKLLAFTVAAVRAAGGCITEIDLRSFELPLYDGDLEQEHGLPEGALRLHAIFKAHDALLLGVTEYNGGVSPLLKNAIDWASRPCGEEPNLAAIRGKLVAMVSCSSGVLGGARAQAHLRQSFQVMGCVLLPETVTVPYADGAFDGASPRDPTVRSLIQLTASRLVALADRLAPDYFIRDAR